MFLKNVPISAVDKMMDGLTGQWGLSYSTTDPNIKKWAKVILFFTSHVQRLNGTIH